MQRLNRTTKCKPAEVLEKARAFFGEGGYGLKVTGQAENYISFEGGGGVVHVTVAAVKEGTSVDLETREWERQIQDFAAKL